MENKFLLDILKNENFIIVLNNFFILFKKYKRANLGKKLIFNLTEINFYSNKN